MSVQEIQEEPLRVCNLIWFHFNTLFYMDDYAIRNNVPSTQHGSKPQHDRQRETGANYNNLLSLQWTEFTCPPPLLRTQTQEQ